MYNQMKILWLGRPCIKFWLHRCPGHYDLVIRSNQAIHEYPWIAISDLLPCWDATALEWHQYPGKANKLQLLSQSWEVCVCCLLREVMIEHLVYFWIWPPRQGAPHRLSRASYLGRRYCQPRKEAPDQVIHLFFNLFSGRTVILFINVEIDPWTTKFLCWYFVSQTTGGTIKNARWFGMEATEAQKENPPSKWWMQNFQKWVSCLSAAATYTPSSRSQRLHKNIIKSPMAAVTFQTARTADIRPESIPSLQSLTSWSPITYLGALSEQSEATYDTLQPTYVEAIRLKNHRIVLQRESWLLPMYSSLLGTASPTPGWWLCWGYQTRWFTVARRTWVEFRHWEGGLCATPSNMSSNVGSTSLFFGDIPG